MELSQKLTRSRRTLAKAASTAATPKRGRPLVIDDDESPDEHHLPSKQSQGGHQSKSASPRKSTRASPPSAKKSPSRRGSLSRGASASPRKSPTKRSKVDEALAPVLAPVLAPTSAGDPPSSPARGKKFNYREYLERRAAGPAAPGSKEIPVGSPECLLGLTFVFTGELESLGREEAQDLVKRYGGRVTSAPSGKTDYVVVGDNAGASKLDKIAKLALKTLSEDGLLDLIRKSAPPTSHPVADQRAAAAAATFGEEQIIKPTAKPAPAATAVIAKNIITTAGGGEAELWTDKYAPKAEDELIGNHANYERILAWLRSWNPQTQAAAEKAVLISGPPGIGKTTAATLACREADMETVEMNASDTRSKTSLHEHVRDIIDNRSLAGFSSFFQSKVPMMGAPRRQGNIILALGESPPSNHGLLQEAGAHHGRGGWHVGGRSGRHGRTHPAD